MRPGFTKDEWYHKDDVLVVVTTKDFDVTKDGVEFYCGYALHVDVEDRNLGPRYCLYEDDGRGNGNLVCSGYDRYDMIRMAKHLGPVVFDRDEENLKRLRNE